MPEEEQFDIYDEAMNRLGTAGRRRVHELGLWHKTFHCWVVTPSSDGDRQLLFQLRSPDKDTYPGLLDISCAGHLAAGESVEDGIRELKEELGLSVSYEELTCCGWTAETKYPGGGWIDREFNHVHLYESGIPLEAYHYQTEEISGLYRISLKAFKELILKKRDTVSAVGTVMRGEGNTKVPDLREVKLADFVPKSGAYYDLLFAQLEKA